MVYNNETFTNQSINLESDMGLFSGISLGDVVPNINIGSVVNSVASVLNPEPSVESSTEASTQTHTYIGSVIAGLTNSVTGGALGNGSGQVDNAYSVGQFLGNIGNQIIDHNMPSVVETVENAVNATPMLSNAIGLITDVAITSAQKTLFQRVTDWVKANKTIVFLISLIPIYFIVKPFLFGKKRSSKRSTKK